MLLRKYWSELNANFAFLYIHMQAVITGNFWKSNYFQLFLNCSIQFVSVKIISVNSIRMVQINFPSNLQSSELKEAATKCQKPGVN
jgi:hypothetical protein